METKVLKAKRGLSDAARLILAGETVAFPTETVYGLGADAFNPSAVKKIFEAKGRPQDNPLIVHLATPKDVEKVAKDIPKEFYVLAKKFMPGPLTVVLPKRDELPDVVTAGGNTVAVRVPANKIARRLISMSSPIAAPSANKSKHVRPTSAEYTYNDMKGLIPLILDGGSCKVGIESTVLDLTSPTPTVLRPGYVTEEMLLKVLSCVEKFGGEIKVAKSPGMKYTHYAPKVPTVIAKTFESGISEYDRAAKEGKRPVLILKNRKESELCGRKVIFVGKTAKEVSKNIYASMLNAEKTFDEIIIEHFGYDGLFGSVMNRVEKSASNKEV